jgi:hypothetical protein
LSSAATYDAHDPMLRVFDFDGVVASDEIRALL